MKIVKGKTYRIKGIHPYFKRKYGTDNPKFEVHGTDIEFWDKSWGLMQGNPCAMLFGMRMGLEGKSIEEVDKEIVWIGHILPSGLAECALESELEEIDVK